MKIIGIEIIEGEPGVIKCLHTRPKGSSDNLETHVGWYPFGDYIIPNNANGARWSRSGHDSDHKLDTFLDAAIKSGLQMNNTLKELSYAKLRVSISGIVGKNGSGKSTILDILYRIINNFLYTYYDHTNKIVSRRMKRAGGFSANLYVEDYGKLMIFHSRNGYISITESAEADAGGKKLLPEIDLDNQENNEKLLKIYEQFFYTVCQNYSIYSFGEREEDSKSIIYYKDTKNHKSDSSWMSPLFSEGALNNIPFVFLPIRNADGSIDVRKETDIAKERITALSLFYMHKKSSFWDGFSAYKLAYEIFEDAPKLYQKLLFETVKKYLPTENRNSMIQPLRAEWRKKFVEFGIASIQDEVLSLATNFLCYESLRLAVENKTIARLLGLIEMSSKEKEEKKIIAERIFTLNSTDCDYKKFIDRLCKDRSLVTLEIRRTINYLKYSFFNKKYVQSSFSDDDFSLLNSTNTTADNFLKSIKEILGENSLTYENLLSLLPPKFCRWDFELKKDDKEVLVGQMSSGERQLLGSLCTILHYLYSVTDENSLSYFDGLKRFNIIIDEAELYYHPEYQRLFICRILELLNGVENLSARIEAINLIIVTHSPFILSDIPSCKILFLKDGKSVIPKKETFAANIYDLLNDGFFLESSTGEFARGNIEEFVNLYSKIKNPSGEDSRGINSEFFMKNLERYRFLIEHIGDEYLKKNLRVMLREMELISGIDNANSIKKQIAEYEEEISRLKSRLPK